MKRVDKQSGMNIVRKKDFGYRTVRDQCLQWEQSTNSSFNDKTAKGGVYFTVGGPLHLALESEAVDVVRSDEVDLLPSLRTDRTCI